MIVDTAIGGQGSRRLATHLTELFRTARDFPRVVEFHLLHPEGAPITRLRLLDSFSNQTIELHEHRYVADQLPIEDWDAGLGLQVEHRDGEIIYKPCRARAGVVITDRERCLYVDSLDVSSSVDRVLAARISLQIETDPQLRCVMDDPELMELKRRMGA